MASHYYILHGRVEAEDGQHHQIIPVSDESTSHESYVRFGDGQPWTTVLDTVGVQGWELVGVHNGGSGHVYYVFSKDR